MTSFSLGESYLRKARARLKVLDLLLADEAYSDVVREAQEVVELALKAVLRALGVEPPKVHDVGPLLVEYRERLPARVAPAADRLAAISHWLRREREIAFYGDIDMIPTDQYGLEEARRAMADAAFVVSQAAALFEDLPAPDG